MAFNSSGVTISGISHTLFSEQRLLSSGTAVPHRQIRLKAQPPLLSLVALSDLTSLGTISFSIT